MNWRVPKLWAGGDVWIIGGGPSLTQQFGIPESCVKSVIAKRSQPSVYSTYMEAIHTKHVIGVNMAYTIGTWMDMVFFGDGPFFIEQAQNLAAWPGLKVSCHDWVIPYPWVKFIPRNTRTWGISTDPGYVCWNANSGAAAISVAANAGAKRIILVGFDMTLGETGQQHWHKFYAPIEVRCKAGVPPFETHLRGFHDIAADAKTRGIEIINASPTSKITEFKKCNVKDLI